MAAVAALAALWSVKVTARRPLLAPVYEFINGLWYEDSTFVRRPMWAAGGRLLDHRPVRVDSTIDLQGGFVVPAFAEGHTHNIGCSPTAAEAAPYVRDGFMYVMVQSNTYPVRQPGPADLDVVCAAAVLTSSGSHLTQLNERSLDRGNFPGLTRADLDGRTHVVIDSGPDLDTKLGGILKDRPAFIKIILAFSEEWGKRSRDTAFVGKRGIDPALVPMIVTQAHGVGTRVSAHVETAADFRVAVAAGVDVIAHLPGLRVGVAAGVADTTNARWLISDADAQAAARRGIGILTTTIAAARQMLVPTEQTTTDGARMREIYRTNIATLRRHRARLAIGSDFYAGNSIIEAFMLGHAPLISGGIAPLGAFDNREILRMLSVVTPQLIFPGRRIGALTAGSEANLLVLAGNPIEDLSNLRRITHRMRGGMLVVPAPPP